MIDFVKTYCLTSIYIVFSIVHIYFAKNIKKCNIVYIVIIYIYTYNTNNLYYILNTVITFEINITNFIFCSIRLIVGSNFV